MPEHAKEQDILHILETLELANLPTPGVPAPIP